MKDIIPIWRAKVVNRELKFLDPERAEHYISTLPVDVEVVVKAQGTKKIRSREQNNYYWGVVIPLVSNETGYSKDETHDILKTMFLKQEITFTAGKDTHTLNVVRSTTNLSTKEIEDYFEEIRMWASQSFNCIIPSPNQVDL